MPDSDVAAEEWFWAVIEATAPDVAALETWLTAAPRETVARFAVTYEIAAGELADYSEGIELDGVAWSEDDMEDLCLWVVGRGGTYWRSVLTGDVSLTDAARAYHDGTGAWRTEVSDPDNRGYAAPGSIAFGVYRTRFGESLRDTADYQP